LRFVCAAALAKCAGKRHTDTVSCRTAIAIPLLTAVLALPISVSLAAVEQVKLDSLKAGAKTYHQVTVLGASETDLYFKHDGGIANVKFKYLEPEIQKRFDYDPKAAVAAEQRQIQEDSAYHETVALEVVAHAQRTAVAAATESATEMEESLADPISGKSLLNRPAPKIEVGKWLAEKPTTEGKAVLVFFWTTWSVPCRKAIPEMNAHQITFRDQLVVIGLSAQEEKELADFSEVKIDFPLAVDPKSKLAAAVGVTSVPQVLLIDARGIVRYVGHPAALDPAALKKILTERPE
jgi:peroxiredoxin